MGITPLLTFLRNHRKIALDTSIFIYQLEANPQYLPFTDYIFDWLERTDSQAVTSTLTMTELLVQPYRVGNQQLVDEYYALLTIYPNLEWVAPDLEISDLAARIRATDRLRTPDALQAATAIRASASGLITNDPIFERVSGFKTLVLEQLI